MVDLMRAGETFDYGGNFPSIRAAVNVNWVRSCNMILNKKNVDINSVRNQLNHMLCSHSGQSIKAEFFWPFTIQPIEYSPFDIEKDIVLCNNEDSKLNLILHAKFDDQSRLFLMKQPIYLKEEFPVNLNKSEKKKAIKIKKVFDFLFAGYIKEFEIDSNMNIPVVISAIIKDYIKVGFAFFYCKGFKNPLYGTDIYHRYQNDNLTYDSA